jgi:hypothetical protein
LGGREQADVRFAPSRNRLDDGFAAYRDPKNRHRPHPEATIMMAFEREPSATAGNGNTAP